MTIMLRDALEETMGGWKQAVPEPWRPVFCNVVLDAKGVPARLNHYPWMPIFPVFKDHKTRKVFQAYETRERKEPNLIGVPYFAHTFRALLVPPDKVKVVIVGQDPYPDITDATGLSFEQGNLADWIKDAHRVAGSLKPILKTAAAAKTGDDSYRAGIKYNDCGWDRIVSDLKQGHLKVLSPNKLFPHYQNQGILWLNTTLTISLFWTPSRDDQAYQKAHSAYWEPFVTALFNHLVSRSDNRHVVFGLWGSWAKNFQTPIRRMAKKAGKTKNVRFVTAGHPVTPAFLKRKKNVFVEINEHLKSLGEKPINWLPA